ncbi:TPA: hypothetical protein EYP13_00445 [Candidatus Micrarchaeota archaeon]|nr:hypothetical protein [Candidatus Micrarchaeota archaeon]
MILGFVVLFLYGGIARVTVKIPSMGDGTKQKINNALNKREKLVKSAKMLLGMQLRYSKKKEVARCYFCLCYPYSKDGHGSVK